VQPVVEGNPGGLSQSEGIKNRQRIPAKELGLTVKLQASSANSKGFVEFRIAPGVPRTEKPRLSVSRAGRYVLEEQI
jgi:hypothetical protein